MQNTWDDRLVLLEPLGNAEGNLCRTAPDFNLVTVRPLHDLSSRLMSRNVHSRRC